MIVIDVIVRHRFGISYTQVNKTKIITVLSDQLSEYTLNSRIK